MAEERWRLVDRNPYYQVSDLGRVKRTVTGRVLKPTQNHKQGRVGYLKVCLGSKKNQVYVHQLVAEAFLGPCPPGHNVDHRDHDRHNNTLANLRYLPKPENDFRWKGRDAAGRNQWESPHLDGEAPPEDHEPMNEVEHEHYQRELVTAGW